MLPWCFSGMFATLTHGLGTFDSLSETLTLTLTPRLPYLFGRIHFGDSDGLRYFATAIVIGGLCSLLRCVWEMRMSPQILANLNGMGPVPVLRLGG